MKELRDISDELIQLSHALGLESRQFSILGEGNTSCRVDNSSFLVKASGTSLATLKHEDVSHVSLERIGELLQREAMTEEEIEQELLDARVDSSHKKPSIETFLHALCLTEGEATWVGHTHTVSINQFLCSQHGVKPFMRHIAPDVIIVCGRHIASVPYVDPGFQLAKAIQAELRRFRDAYGYPPKLLLMENHGPVALGKNAKEVLNIMLMADKWAKMLAGCFAVGEPNYLPEEEADRIDGRLDEHVRRRELLKA